MHSCAQAARVDGLWASSARSRPAVWAAGNLCPPPPTPTRMGLLPWGSAMRPTLLSGPGLAAGG